MSETGKVLHLTPEKTIIKKRKKEIKKIEEDKKFLVMISLATELGLAVVLPLVGGAFLGRFLDENLGTAPRLTLSLIFFGLMLSFVNIYNLLKEK